MTYQELCSLSREGLIAAPCGCVSCATCRGTGDVWTPSPINPPFDEPEPCSDCRGGITDICDRCQLLEEMDCDCELGTER